MRGRDRQGRKLLGCLHAETLAPPGHPLRAIRPLAKAALDRLHLRFEQMYATSRRPPIAPEKLLRAPQLRVFFSVRSERHLIEQRAYTMLFRCFVGPAMDAPVWGRVGVYQRPRPSAGGSHCLRLPGRDARRSATPAAAVGRAFPGGRHVHRSLAVDAELPAPRRRRATGAGAVWRVRLTAKSAATRRTPPPPPTHGSITRRPGRRRSCATWGRW